MYTGVMKHPMATGNGAAPANIVPMATGILIPGAETASALIVLTNIIYISTTTTSL